LNRRRLSSVPVVLFQPGQNYAEFVSANIPASAVQVTAILNYQTASKEYIDFLASTGGLDVQTLKLLRSDLKSPPELMAWDAKPLRSYFMPSIHH